MMDIAILNICGIDYRSIINRISKSDAVNELQNVGWAEKRRVKNEKLLQYIKWLKKL